MQKKKPKRMLTGSTADFEKVLEKFQTDLIAAAKEAETADRWQPQKLLLDLMYGLEDVSLALNVDVAKLRITKSILKLVKEGKIRYPGQVTYVLED